MNSAFPHATVRAILPSGCSFATGLSPALFDPQLSLYLL